MAMSSELLGRVLPKINHDFNFKQSDDGQWLNQGKCPACGKRSLFTAADNPWVLRCGRETKCGVEYEIKSLYPEEFGNFNKRFEATPQNPNAVADAYMTEARGFPLGAIKGFYNQEKYWHPNANKGTATVRFYLPDSTSYMERFVEPIEITEDDGSKTVRKQNFKGPHRGLWWQPPGMTIDDGDTVWITEAIIDTISLYLSGIKSVAILSCSNYPETQLNKYKGKDINWVFALDNDKAGKNATIKFTKRMKNAGFTVTAAQAPAKEKRDWNDLYCDNKLTDSDIGTYLYHGSLLIAKDISEKCALIRQRTNAAFFVTDFDNRLFAFKIKDEDYRSCLKGLTGESEDSEGDPDAFNNTATQIEAIKMAAHIEQIVNARVEFLYFQRNETTDESWYYGRVHYPDARKSMNLDFTPGQLTAPSEFKKRLASAHGAWFSGSAKHLDWMGSRWLQHLKLVQLINYVGYTMEHKAYIFPNAAVSGGRLYELNQEDYFEIGINNIKSSFRRFPMTVETTNRNYQSDWAIEVYNAFGTNGIIAATFWFASLFAEQTRHKFASFPFLEMCGEPACGKTTLVNFLWRVWGRINDEGIDPNKNSSVGNQRKMTQVSNMPIVFMEADREQDGTSHYKKYDWNETKGYFDGKGIRVTGVKTGGNETNETPFRGTLVIEQNTPVNAHKAVLERIVQIEFSKEQLNHETRKAADKLSAMTRDNLSYFVIKATMAEQQVMNHVIKNVRAYTDYLHKDDNIKEYRIAENHAKLIAFAEMFGEIAELPKQIIDETTSALYRAAIEREKSISKDHPIVEEFWDMFNFLNGKPMDATTCALDHSSDPRTIAVNLNEFVEMAGYAKQQIPPLIELKRRLKTSKNYKFIDSSKTVSSAIKQTATGGRKAVRCWIFELPKGASKVAQASDEKLPF